MKREEKTTESIKERIVYKNCRSDGGSGAIYGLGMIGALFYFLQRATDLGSVLLGIGKAIFWPAVLLFRILTDLGM